MNRWKLVREMEKILEAKRTLKKVHETQGVLSLKKSPTRVNTNNENVKYGDSK